MVMTNKPLFGSRWILGPLCLASLGLEGIGSSSFTFDSLVAAYSNPYKYYSNKYYSNANVTRQNSIRDLSGSHGHSNPH